MIESKRNISHTGHWRGDSDKQLKGDQALGASHTLRQSNYHFETNQKTSVAQKVILITKEHNFYSPQMTEPLCTYMLEYNMNHGHEYNNTPDMQLNLFTSASDQEHSTAVFLLLKNKSIWHQSLLNTVQANTILTK